jgi:hypothetical protein
MFPRIRKVCWQRIGGGFFLLALASLGCGSPHTKDKASVTGKVTLAGQPLPSGSITFLGADNWKQVAAIGPDGSYRMEYVPFGEMKIGIHSGPGLWPGMRAERRKGGGHVRIPARYQNPQTSGLTYTVTADGEQDSKPVRCSFNIELKP